MGRVLLSVEDNDGEYYVIKMAVEESGIPVRVFRVSDGEQAIFFLEKSHGFELAPRPDLVMLNLNLPKKNGFQVLTEIRASELLRSIPVVMFTSSVETRERQHALALGAEDFVSKPQSLRGLIEAVRSVCVRYLADS